MNATQLTIQLPQAEATFLEAYAERHKVTVEELFNQFVKQLRTVERYTYHPDIEKFAGIIPSDIDVQKEYYDYLEEKHK